jgi:hypothetical protein
MINISWKRHSFYFSIGLKKIKVPYTILCVCELPNEKGVCIVLSGATMGDDETNAFIYSYEGEMTKKIEVILHPGVIFRKLEKFHECAVFESILVLIAFEYQFFFDVDSFELIEKKYYR